MDVKNMSYDKEVEDAAIEQQELKGLKPDARWYRKNRQRKIATVKLRNTKLDMVKKKAEVEFQLRTEKERLFLLYAELGEYVDFMLNMEGKDKVSAKEPYVARARKNIKSSNMKIDALLNRFETYMKVLE